MALAVSLVVEAVLAVFALTVKTSAASSARADPAAQAGIALTAWSRQAAGRPAWSPAAARAASKKAFVSRKPKPR